MRPRRAAGAVAPMAPDVAPSAEPTLPPPSAAPNSLPPPPAAPNAMPPAVPVLAPTEPRAIEDARAVLRTEADGLGRLARALDGPLGERFARAVDLIEALPGRVVVSGIGKSGHVGRKVAATFASTGTPAMFVHPAEASHGDLGMVLENDAVLVLSRSGETAELADLVAHARRFGLSLLAITERAQSSLGRAADIALVLPEAEEACPITAAPTTSTLMQMALGDALAVTLLRRRGFTASDFGLFHPGGRLGARLKRVSELMHAGDAIPLASPATALLDAVLLMTRKAFGCVGVLGPDGRLAGIVTDGDLRRAASRDFRALRVADVMNPNPVVIGADRLAADALRLMNSGPRPVLSLFATDSAGRPVGIVHVHDLLRAGIA